MSGAPTQFLVFPRLGRASPDTILCVYLKKDKGKPIAMKKLNVTTDNIFAVPINWRDTVTITLEELEWELVQRGEGKVERPTEGETKILLPLQPYITNAQRVQQTPQEVAAMVLAKLATEFEPVPIALGGVEVSPEAIKVTYHVGSPTEDAYNFTAIQIMREEGPRLTLVFREQRGMNHEVSRMIMDRTREMWRVFTTSQ